MDMDFDITTVFVGMFVGCIGLGFFMYGKKQQKAMPLICGIALMVYPYFVSNLWLNLFIGIVLCAIPYFVRI